MSADAEETTGEEPTPRASTSAVDVFKALSESHPEAFGELTAWLAAALVKDQYARLNEGGYAAEHRVPLAKVFVDLAANQDGSDEEEPEPGELDEPSTSLPPGIVASMLLAATASPPRRSFLKRENATDEKPAPVRTPAPTSPHRVLIAGPGQGKSTVVQYLSQLHRVALLRSFRDRLQEHAGDTLDLLVDLREKQQLPEPVEACLPIFIPLNRFAGWLARERVEAHGIEQFVALQALDVLRAQLSVATLALALDRLPWLLVLDGLDEVPDATDRHRALDAVDRFLEARPQARCIVVATTRPQSYTGEFGGLTARSLCAMSKARALTYARQLLAGRYGTDGERRRQIEERVDHASKEPATLRLMRTPLQVTIMTALLADAARAPVERWRLFREFYNVIVRRECDRDDGVARMVSKFRTHLDTVHERVGLLLQVECEREGGSDASMDRTRFMEIVEQRLSEEGYSRAEATEHARELARIAEDRLVFLTGVRAGRVGFELRSFQELMAAEALFNGRESAVIDRARVIARSSAWTNVLLFMASRCMATGSSLRDDVTIELCKWLDDPRIDANAAALRMGARYALELLDEGALSSSPKLLGDVARYSLGLLELPPVDILVRFGTTLSRLCLDPDTKEHVAPLVTKHLTQCLSATPPENASAPWIVALVLAENDVEPVRKLVDASWPDDVEGERKLLAAFTWLTDLSSKSLRERMPSLIPRHPERFWRPFVNGGEWYSGWVHAHHRRNTRARVLGRTTSVEVQIRNVGLARSLEVPDAQRLAPYWKIAAAASGFEAHPSAATLAAALSVLAEHADAGILDRMAEETSFSWVLEACVRSATSAEDLRTLAARARAAELGDLDEWRAAEVRWLTHGFTEGDLVAFVDTDGLPGRGIGERGAAFGQLTLQDGAKGSARALAMLVNLHHRASRRGSRAFLGALVLRSAEAAYVANEMLESPLSVEELERLARDHGDAVTINAVLALTGAGGDISVRAALTWVSSQPLFAMRSADLRPQPIADSLLAALRAPMAPRELLRVLGFLPVAELPMTPVGEEVLVLRSDDNEEVEASILALEVHRGGLSVERAGAIGTRLAALTTPTYAACLIVEPMLERRQNALTDGEVALARTILTEGENTLPGSRVWAFSLLKSHQDSLTTTLATPETWEALRLPLPAPLPTSPSSVPPGSDPSVAADVPIHFREIEIQGLRCYSAMRMTDLFAEPDRGQWVFVLGENGAGKSTLLRATAMALIGREVGDLALGTSEAPYRRPGTQRATIDVRMPGTAVYQAVVDGENGRERFVVGPSYPDTERPFVVAYGCRRGSALGGPERALDFSRLAAIRTLFDDPTAGLVHGEQWLMNLHHGAAVEQTPNGAQELLDAVLDVVAELLPHVGRPTIDENGVWVRGPATGDVAVRLIAMSDGYLTSLGWVLDMMARWIKQKREAGRKIAKRFNEAMTGVVLLDELDLHLHPRWQVRVVRDLKKLFPRMTFVVTTHNPMTLVGAHKREIWTLQRDAAGAMSAARHDTDPRLRTGSELYARFFGLEELYPDDLGRKLRRYGFLASSPYRTDDEEREVHDLLGELRRKEVDPGFDPTPREGS